MQNPTIRFLHIGDTHFGVHYAVKPKNLLRRAYGDLFFQKSKDVIHSAILNHKIDFIIHCGDFFNRSKPPPKVIDRAVKPFLFAANKGIPIYLLPGNHERSKLPLGLLSFHDNIKLFSKPTSYYFQKHGINIKILGFPFYRENIQSKFTNLLSYAWNNCKNDFHLHHFSILLLHQLIEGSRLENYTFRTGNDVVPYIQLPNYINYIACGHVHRFQFLHQSLDSHSQSPHIQSTHSDYSIYQDISRNLYSSRNYTNQKFNQNPVVAYSGSLERVSLAEINEAKGYIIGKLSLSQNDSSIKSVEYNFHSIPPIDMIHHVWDLNKKNIVEDIDKTIDNFYSYDTKRLSNQSFENSHLTAVSRIKIEGKRKLNSIEQRKLSTLKSIAKQFNIYVMFSGANIRNYSTGRKPI